MEELLSFLRHIFGMSPEIAIFLSLGLGYAVGKIKFGTFQLGGVAGSLLVAVCVSQIGVDVNPAVKSVLFYLFIYAVGYESGPQFFRSLNRESLREIALATTLSIVSLATILVLAKVMHLDKGIAAGIAAGALTETALMGTASDALARMGLENLQGNIATGFAVTYIFGSLGAIIICANILPMFMGRSIRDDAIAYEVSHQVGTKYLGENKAEGVYNLVTRLYRINETSSKTIRELEHQFQGITIEKVKRKRIVIAANPYLKLMPEDIVLVIGRRESVLAIGKKMGKEEHNVKGLNIIIQKQEVAMTDQFEGRTVKSIIKSFSTSARHGIYILSIRREDNLLPVESELVIQAGDIVTIYGSEDDIKKVSNLDGVEFININAKTDFVYMGFGMVAGLLLGLLSVKIGSIPLTLGSGGGLLVSGLLFSWYRSKKQTFGEMPSGAILILKDLGLAGFIVVVGLNSGLEAVQTIKSTGWSIFGAGLIVTTVPLLITMVIGKYIFRYKNAAVFAGALAGSRSANPAFGSVLSMAGNSTPTVPFAITYGLANVLLALLGPIIIALV